MLGKLSWQNQTKCITDWHVRLFMISSSSLNEILACRLFHSFFNCFFLLIPVLILVLIFTYPAVNFQASMSWSYLKFSFDIIYKGILYISKQNFIKNSVIVIKAVHMSFYFATRSSKTQLCFRHTLLSTFNRKNI